MKHLWCFDFFQISHMSMVYGRIISKDCYQVAIIHQLEEGLHHP